MILNVPDELSFEVHNDKIRFEINGISTNWMSQDDGFIQRVDRNALNHDFLVKHISKEIEIKNILDEGIVLLNSQKYMKAVNKFDEVLFYDPEYAVVLLNKSYALRGQRHFVKALRNYKRAVKFCDDLKDQEYYRTLLKEANNERDNFPKLKLNIYAGDVYFSKGDFEKAIASYNKALVNPSKFKDQILSKLLNKKATALVKIDRYDEALECFKNSIEVGKNDYAVFGEGVCEYNLDRDINDGFKSHLNISKRQMLKQANVLNDLGFFTQALSICDFLCKNHFKEDDFYLKLRNTRKISLNG